MIVKNKQTTNKRSRALSLNYWALCTLLLWAISPGVYYISILEMMKQTWRREAGSQDGSMSNMKIPGGYETHAPLGLGSPQERGQWEPQASALSNLQAPYATSAPSQAPQCTPALGCTSFAPPLWALLPHPRLVGDTMDSYPSQEEGYEPSTEGPQRHQGICSKSTGSTRYS